MGAASGAHTIGNAFDGKSPLGAVWGDGLSDLEVHGYEPVKELLISGHAAVLVVRRRGWPDEQFVVKAFTSCRASELTKGEVGPLQEAMLLRSLEHPHIVKYVEAWWTPDQVSSGRLSLVMEHAEDGDLHAPRLAMRRQQQHLEEVLLGRWLRQIVEALVYLHGRGVVHRDLKTSNVFLKDSWATALLGDFGISTVLARSAFSKNCAGTPAYMSPEVVRSEQFGTAVDIWAVGIILYELMALELPFTGSLVSLIYKICCTDAREAPLRDAGYSEKLISLVQQVLVRDASARPSAEGLRNSEFWNECALDHSLEAAHSACGAARSSKLLEKQPSFPLLGKKVSLGSAETGPGTGESLAILQSWSSSEPTWGATESSMPSLTETPLHGPLSPKLFSDFYYEEEDSVTRSASQTTCAGLAPCPPSLTVAEPSPLEDADEELRQELHAAHSDGRALSPEYLEGLLAKLGASNDVSPN